MIVNIKKIHPAAVIPSYSREGDAGMDLTAVSREWENKSRKYCYGIGIAIEIPYGYAGLILPRSSIKNYDLTLCNSVGLIDSNYRGEIKAIFSETILSGTSWSRIYEVGDRIAQLLIIPYPQVEWQAVERLSDTARGDNGFGSSGV